MVTWSTFGTRLAQIYQFIACAIVPLQRIFALPRYNNVRLSCGTLQFSHCDCGSAASGWHQGKCQSASCCRILRTLQTTLQKTCRFTSRRPGQHGYHYVVSSAVSFHFARALAHSIRPSHSPNDVLDERLSVDVSSWGRPQEPADRAPLKQCKHAANTFGMEGSHANISSTSSRVTLM